MKVSRAGIIKNLNARPLAYGLEDRDDFIVETPARVVALFEQGELEVALIPPIELIKHDTFEVLLDAGAVSCNGRAASAIAVHKMPWNEVERIAVDTHARGAGILLHILLSRQLAPGREFHFEKLDIDPGHIPVGFDAAVVTGDRALLWPNYDPLTGTHRFAQLELTDLGTVWTEWTGLPLVLHVWAAREGQDIAEWHERIATAALESDKQFDTFIEKLSHRLGAPFSVDYLEAFLGEIVSYEFGERQIRGLLRYLDEAAALGLSPLTGKKTLTLRSLHKTLTEDIPATLDGDHGEISVRVQPRTAVNFLQKAKHAFFRRQYRKALKALADGVEDHPALDDNPEVPLLRGRANLFLMRYIEARPDLLRAKAHPQTDRMARYALARMTLDLGRTEKAAHQLREIVHDFPRDISFSSHSHGLIATCAVRRGLAHSHEFYRELAERAQLTSSELLVEHGKSLIFEQMWDEAAAYFGEAVNVDPTNPQAYFHLANLFFMHNQFLKAEEIMAYGLEQAKEEIMFFTLLGDLRREQEKFTDAATLYRLALEISPRGAVADYLIYQIAHCLYRQGSAAEARSHYMVVAKHFPKSALRERAKAFAEALQPIGDGDTPDRYVIDDFPSNVEVAEMQGPKAFGLVLHYHGFDGNWQQLGDGLIGDDVGWADLRRFAESADFTAFFARGNWDTVQLWLQHNLPVMIAETCGLEWRYVALIGYDSGKRSVTVQDPREQLPFEVPWAELEAAWRPNSHCALLLVPPTRPGLADELELADDELLVKWIEAMQAHETENSAAAREFALEAAALDPLAQAPQKLLVEMDLDAGKAAEARDRCESLLEKEPTCFWARKYLGDALLALDMLDAAIDTYHRAKQECRQESALWWAQGLAFELSDNLVRARQCYARSLELETIAPVALRMAQVCKRQARVFEAAYWWEVALELDPENDEARANLDWFDRTQPEPTGYREQVFSGFVRQVPLPGDPSREPGDDADDIDEDDQPPSDDAGSDDEIDLATEPPETALLGPDDTFETEPAVIAHGGVTSESASDAAAAAEHSALATEPLPELPNTTSTAETTATDEASSTDTETKPVSGEAAEAEVPANGADNTPDSPRPADG